MKNPSQLELKQLRVLLLKRAFGGLVWRRFARREAPLRPFSQGRVNIADPRFGNRTMSIEDFTEIWTDGIRVRVNTQEGDLTHLTAANMEFRRCIISIRQHYIELATKVLAQLEQLDDATRDMIQERQNRSFDARAKDENLISLAHRLKPAGSRQTSADDFND